MVYRLKKDRDRAQMMFKLCPPRPAIIRTPELSSAYNQYISDGLADTDGYYAPLDFGAWARTCGLPLTNTDYIVMGDSDEARNGVIPTVATEPAKVTSPHADCSHPKTKAARARCRKDRAARG
jgi:hypothetical protein